MSFLASRPARPAPCAVPRPHASQAVAQAQPGPCGQGRKPTRSVNTCMRNKTVNDVVDTALSYVIHNTVRYDRDAVRAAQLGPSPVCGSACLCAVWSRLVFQLPSPRLLCVYRLQYTESENLDSLEPQPRHCRPDAGARFLAALVHPYLYDYGAVYRTAVASASLHTRQIAI